MRHTHIKFSRKMRIFAAYSPLAPRSYVASPELSEAIGAHFWAEENQEALSAWVAHGHADPKRAEMIGRLAVATAEFDDAYKAAFRTYRNRHLL